jgi:hypothetical protein
MGNVLLDWQAERHSEAPCWPVPAAVACIVAPPAAL